MASPLALVSLAACVAPVEPADPRPAIGAGTPPTTTGGPPPDPACVDRQEVMSEAIVTAWRDPAGAVYAAGWSRALKIRTPDGRWDEEPLPDGLRLHELEGALDGTVWGLGSEGRLWRRDGPSQWAEVPHGALGVRDLAVIARDQVRLLVHPPPPYVGATDSGYGYGYGYDNPPPELWAWDGGAWTTTVLGPVRTQLGSLVVLPDGRSLVAGDGEVDLVLPGGSLAPVSAPSDVSRLAVGPDGTLVAFGGTVAIGTAEGGLVEHRPPTDHPAFTAAWVGGPDDVIVAAERWERGLVDHAAVWRWDGSGWTPLLEDTPGRFAAVHGPANDVVALGDDEHELVWAGDGSGLALEREDWGVGSLGYGIVADRARGEAYGIGYERTLQRWDGSSWVPHPLPGLLRHPERIAGDDGRVVLLAGDQAAVWDEGAVTVTPLEPGVFFSAVAASSGSLFVFGTRDAGGVAGLVDRGDGFEPLDVSTFPAGAEPHTAWADGPDDVWIGVELPAASRREPSTGGLVHWDGATFTLVHELATDPDWLERASDGRLVFTQFSEPGGSDDSLFVLGDDGLPAPIAGIPYDVRAAVLLDDGRWVVSTVAREATAEGDDLVRVLLEGVPGQPFTELLRGEHSVMLAGHDGVVWSSDETSTWTRRGCE